MVHALREAHRVLKPDGLLVDLRPAAIHRRVGLTNGADHEPRWTMRENFDDDRAADRAIAEVVDEGWFKPDCRKRFPCYRVMDTVDEFQAWLTDFVHKGKFPPHDWLVRLVERELGRSPAKTKIVVSGPLILRGLRKRVRNISDPKTVTLV